MGNEWLTVEVAEKVVTAGEIALFKLVDASGHQLPAFEAGAHVDVELPCGLVRQYSLCGSPATRDCYRLGVLREKTSRGGSRSAHDDLQVGSSLRISKPRNLFPLRSGTYSYLFAGGIGITPIMAMAETLYANGERFEAHYCVRSRQLAAFQERIAGSPFAENFSLHASDEATVSKLGAGSLLEAPDPGANVYVCGPEGFMAYVIDSARKAGLSDAQIHCEQFSKAVSETDRSADFRVTIPSTKRTIPVPADQTVLEALIANGVDIPFSCEQGICGSCAMRVLGGEPDHRDMCFNDDEHATDEYFTPCCSRAFSPELVIEFLQ